MILFLVTRTQHARDATDHWLRLAHVVTLAKDREEAKRNARSKLLTDPDQYIVTPMTGLGDPVYFDLQVA